VHLGAAPAGSPARRRQPARLEVDRAPDRERGRSAVARVQRGDRPRRARGRCAGRAAMDLRARLRTALARARAVPGDRRGGERGVGSRRSGPVRAAHPERGPGGEVLLRLLAAISIRLLHLGAGFVVYYVSTAILASDRFVAPHVIVLPVLLVGAF